MLNVKKLGINNIFFVIAITILIIAASTCVFYSTVDNTVLAETTSESLLNFNQLVSNDYINFKNDVVEVKNISTINNNLKNHILYFSIKLSNVVNCAFALNTKSGNIDIHTFNDSNKTLITINNDVNINYFGVYISQTNINISDFQIIDLTQMYGAGNEPTLEECETIFATIYNYTQSLIVDSGYMDYNIGYENGYIAGQTDMLTSQQFYQNDLTNIGYILTGSKIDTLNAGFNFSNNLYTYSSVEKFNKIYLKYSSDFSFNKGSTYVIKIENFSCNDFSELTIGYTLEDGSYNDLTSISSDSFTYSFLNNETNGTITNFYIDIGLKNSDYIKSFSVKNITMYGQNDQEQIYNSAYQQGYATGYNSAKETYATEGNFSFMVSAFNGLGEILNIEVLPNVPIWVFVAIPLFFGLIAFIFKLIGS